MKVGVEIHAPLTIEAPPVAALKELFTRLDTPWLGFIPDMSSSMRAVPDAVDDAHRAAGIAPELTALTKALWAEDGPTMAKFPELESRAAEAGASPPQIGNLKMLFTMHGKMDPERWADFFPHVVHVHGKFYGIVDGADPSIDWPAVARVLVEQGYDGFISSEYEAHAYTDRYDRLRPDPRPARHAQGPARVAAGGCPMSRVLIIGSGPTGATYARRLLEQTSDVSVLMVEAGPVVSTPPGMNAKNIDDPAEQSRAREASQGRGEHSAGTAGLPGGTAAEGTVTARFGTYLVGRPAEGSGGLPAAAVSACVGGQGVHWTCATPRPEGSERIDFLPDLDALLDEASALLHVTGSAFGDSPQAAAIMERVGAEFAADGLTVRPLPVAADPRPDGTLRWGGTDVVLGPLAEGAHGDRFELRPEHARRPAAPRGRPRRRRRAARPAHRRRGGGARRRRRGRGERLRHAAAAAGPPASGPRRSAAT